MHAHMCSAEDNFQSLQTEQKTYVLFKQNFNDDSDGAYLTSFEKEFQSREANENERSLSVPLMHAILLRRGIVCELE